MRQVYRRRRTRVSRAFPANVTDRRAITRRRDRSALVSFTMTRISPGMSAARRSCVTRIRSRARANDRMTRPVHSMHRRARVITAASERTPPANDALHPPSRWIPGESRSMHHRFTSLHTALWSMTPAVASTAPTRRLIASTLRAMHRRMWSIAAGVHAIPAGVHSIAWLDRSLPRREDQFPPRSAAYHRRDWLLPCAA